jgi:hypothetical protein
MLGLVRMFLAMGRSSKGALCLPTAMRCVHFPTVPPVDVSGVVPCSPRGFSSWVAADPVWAWAVWAWVIVGRILYREQGIVRRADYWCCYLMCPGSAVESEVPYRDQVVAAVVDVGGRIVLLASSLSSVVCRCRGCSSDCPTATGSYSAPRRSEAVASRNVGR